MKNIVFLSIILLSIGCFSTPKKADKTALIPPIVVPQSYAIQSVAPKKTVLSEDEKKGIKANRTNIKILLDDLVSGETVDTTILKGATITTYSFTPQINKWDVTDTCYSARYFLTIDVRQEITPYTKEILEKKVAEMDTQIAEEEKRTAAKKQLRAKLKAQ